MKYPEFLKDGGTIGFAAPSFGAAAEPYYSAFQNALKRFRAQGFRCVTGPNVYASDGVGISSTPENCGRELTECYCSPDSGVLLSVGGGELMNETLEHVDFERLRGARPKWFMGYSDNTHLGFLLPTLCDTASLYAPCAPAFGMEPLHPAVEDAWQLLRGQKLAFRSYDGWEKESLKSPECPLAPYHITEENVPVFRNWDGAPLRGRLLGGCLDVLNNLAGTEFDRVPEFCERYREDGIVWFLESCDLGMADIRRALWHLEHAGWFRYAKGFLIGRPLHFGEVSFGIDRHEAVMSRLGSMGLPVLMDLDIGHLPPMLPLMCGALAEITPAPHGIGIRYILQ